MTSWTFYPAFLGALISILGWTYFVFKEHDHHNPRNLSEIAYEKHEALRYYRIFLWVCGPLFAVTFFGYIVPRINHPLIFGIVFSFISLPEIIIGFLPAMRRKIGIHDFVAGIMGAAMIAAGFLFAWNLTGVYSYIELTLAIVMSMLGVLFVATKRMHLRYEIPLLYLSHFSILIAAVALIQ